MALPEDKLSTTPVVDEFLGAASLPISPLVSFTDGGVALDDPSLGLMYQVWSAKIEDDKIILYASNRPETVLYEGLNLTAVSLAFDRNMRANYIYTEGGVTYLRWYDTSVNAMVTTTLGADYITPHIDMDDKRPEASDISDIILAYVRDGALCYRQQRDRYRIERVLDVEWVGIKKIGMSINYRFQFERVLPW